MPRMAPETHALLEAAVHAVPISVLTHVGEKVEARRGPASTYRHNVLFLRLQGAPYDGRTIFGFMNDTAPDWSELTDSNIDTAMRKILGAGFNRHLRQDWPGRF